MSKIHVIEDSKFISNISNTFYAVLDGSKIPDMDTFYEAISTALNFPDYFGENLDALDELLYEMDWIEQDYAMLLILNNSELLSHDKLKRETIVNLFANIDNPYFEVVLM